MVLLMLCGGCEIRPLDPDTGRAVIEEASETFDATSFVDEHWSARILPTILSEALGLDSVLTDLRSMDAEQLANMQPIMIHGTGRVVELEDASRARLLQVDHSPYDGQADVGLQVGPVLRGTALRDALPFITFDQFVNQLEYANVSRSLHERLLETVLNDLDAEAFVGQEISFYGVLAIQDPTMLVVTPVEITAGGS